MLTTEDRSLIDKRRKLLRHLGLVTWLLPLVWIATCVATWLRYPLLSNPWHLQTAIRDRELARPTLESLCMMAPFLVLLVQMLVIVFIVMGLIMLYRERRWIDRLSQLDRETQETGSDPS